MRKGDGLTEHQATNQAGSVAVDQRSDAASERLAEHQHVIETEMVDDGHYVGGHAVEREGVVAWRRRISRAVAAEVHPYRTRHRDEPLRNRLEQSGAEAVGVQEHQWRPVAAPVERADA